jgi:translocation and assembly module TamA
VARVPANAAELLATQGHFSARVQVRLHTGAEPPAVTVQADPGPQARVASVALHEQALNHPPADPALLQAMRAAWALPEGQAFTQAAWDQAKAQALHTLTAGAHPAARISASLADVDAERAQVHLSVHIETGPVFTLGEIRVVGLQRFETAWVQQLVSAAGLEPGQAHSQGVLQAAQQRLARSGYFDSVTVHIDPQGPAQGAPVVVSVREARVGRLVLGIGASTDNGTRLSAEHTWRRVPGLDWMALSLLKLERDTRTAQTELRSPTDARGWRWVALAKAERQIDGTGTTTSQQLRLGQAQDTPAHERQFYLQWDRARSTSPLERSTGTDSAERALSLHTAWTRHRFDHLPFPGSGHGLAAELGGGWTLGRTRAPYLRATARWQGLWPLAQAARGRWVTRAQVGTVWARNDAPVPDSQLFLTGGDQSVRGYPLRDIGIAQSDGSVRAGRHLAVASVEWQRPWLQGTQATGWETALFIDAGAVANRPGDLRARVGVGAGLRYLSPVGPLQLDLAYGVDRRKLRLHLSVGFVF